MHIEEGDCAPTQRQIPTGSVRYQSMISLLRTAALAFLFFSPPCQMEGKVSRLGWDDEQTRAPTVRNVLLRLSLFVSM